MTEEKLEGFKTSCNKCIFAQQKVVFPQTIQIGCQLDRLKKFKNQNRANLDPTNTFYIIDGICNTCRGERWKTVHNGKNLIATVERETQVGVDIVLYTIDDELNYLDIGISRAIRACVKQRNIRPKTITIVIKRETANYSELYKIIQEIVEPYEIPFQLVRVMDKDADLGRCVEMGIDKCRNQFVAIFDIVHSIPINTLNILNIAINKDLLRFVLVLPAFEYSGMIISRNVFKLLGKNKEQPIFEKIMALAEEQEREDMVLTWEKLWSLESLL